MINNIELHLNKKQAAFAAKISKKAKSQNFFIRFVFLTLTIKISRKYETESEQKIYKILAAISDQVTCYRTNRWMKHSCCYCIYHLCTKFKTFLTHSKNSTKENKVQPESVEKTQRNCYKVKTFHSF